MAFDAEMDAEISKTMKALGLRNTQERRNVLERLWHKAQQEESDAQFYDREDRD
jgi:Fe2+ or Zn2+ uptake regulation protein